MQPAKGRFIPEFEPIRGLAALTVAFMHSFFVIRIDPANDSTMSAAASAFNGFAAVNLFFVLSGVVLGLALDRYSGTFMEKWRQFEILRVFRIYPMIFVVTATICSYLLLAHQHANYDAATEWFNRNYAEPLGWYRAIQNILLLKSSLNPVAWTLMVEMAMALGFPVMHFIARRNGRLVNLLILGALVALALFAEEIRALLPPNAISNRFVDLIVLHAYKFYLGLILPMFVNLAFVNRVSSISIGYFAFMIAAMAVPRPWMNSIDISDTPKSLIESVAAAFLLAPFCVAGAPRIAAGFFDSAPLRWLGRVSYSFYLWHFFVLYVIATLLLALVSPDPLRDNATAYGAGLALVSIVVAGLASEATFRTVEVRFMDLGRRLVRSFAGRGLAPKAA